MLRSGLLSRPDRTVIASRQTYPQQTRTVKTTETPALARSASPIRKHPRRCSDDDVAVSSAEANPPRQAFTRTARARRAPRARRAQANRRWPLALCAGIYAVAVLLTFHDIITSVYVDSDAALGPVLGQAIGHIPSGSFISLGNHAWYEEWLVLLASRGLPAHLTLWKLAPLSWSLIGLGLLAWSTRSVLDGWSAVLSGAALLSVGAFGRFCLLALNWHSLSLVHTIVLASVSLWLVPRIGAYSWRVVLALGAGLGVLSALPTASDSLFPFWALAPFVIAGLLLARRCSPRERARLLAYTSLVVALAVAGGLVLASIMRHSGITARALPVGLIAPAKIGHNLTLLLESYAYLGGGTLGASRFDAGSVLALLSAILVLAALALVLAATLRALASRSTVKRTPGVGRAPTVGRERSTRSSDARLYYVSFWSTSLLATSLVFVLSDAPRDVLSGRYLLAGYAAIAALLPLAAQRNARARALLAAGVCTFALIATAQVLRAPFQVIKPPQDSLRFPGPDAAAALVRYARQEHVTYGYGGYWDAEELTWGTGFRVLVRPVRVCTSKTHALCYPQLGMISSWYVPRPRIRTLLLVDSVGTSFNGILAPDPALGKPLSERRLGYIAAYVYPYDIASRLRAPRCGFSWAHPC